MLTKMVLRLVIESTFQPTIKILPMPVFVLCAVRNISIRRIPDSLF